MVCAFLQSSGLLFFLSTQEETLRFVFMDTEMTRWSYFNGQLLPFAAILTVEFSNVAMNTLYTAAVSKGLSFNIFMTYSYAVASIVLFPLAIFAPRKTTLPTLSICCLAKFSFLGFIGYVGEYLCNLGIKYSNITLNSAMTNLTPACVFVLAILFRMEKLNLRSFSSRAKIIGAFVSITGALIVVLYNGPIVASGNIMVSTSVLSIARWNWILGGALLATGYIVASFWCIFKGLWIEEYTSEFVVSFFYSFTCLMLSLPVGIASEPMWSSWKVPADIRLISILYSGIMGTGFAITIHTYGNHVKGPVFVSLFKPLSIPITAIATVIFLSDDLYLGSVVGSSVITLGFYTMMWGRRKEGRTEDRESSMANETIPLITHSV